MSRIRRRSLVTPRDLFTGSHNGGWWDGLDLASMFQLSTGATAVTAAADPIGRWCDKSGLGNHMLQATSGQRPTLDATFGVDFNNAATQNLGVALRNSWAGPQLHAIVAARINTFTVNYNRVLSAWATGFQDYNSTLTGGLILRDSSNSAVNAFRNSAAASTVAISAATNYRMESLFNGVSHVMRVGSTTGNPVATAGVGNGAFNFTHLYFAINIQDGSLGDDTIAEAIVRNTPFDSGELDFIRNWYARRWGV